MSQTTIKLHAALNTNAVEGFSTVLCRIDEFGVKADSAKIAVAAFPESDQKTLQKHGRFILECSGFARQGKFLIPQDAKVVDYCAPAQAVAVDVNDLLTSAVFEAADTESPF